MPFDQNQLKTTLTRIAAEALIAFAEAHRHEQFYGFAFDCNADYCEVVLCLNTEEDLQRMAKSLKEAPRRSFLPNFDKAIEEKYGRQPKPLWHDKSEPQIIEALRWEAGDWKYHGFYNCSNDPGWLALATDVSEADQSDSDHERFLEAVCGVLPEIQGAFARLNRTTGFRALVIDHDESVEKAWSRLARLQVEDGA